MSLHRRWTRRLPWRALALFVALSAGLYSPARAQAGQEVRVEGDTTAITLDEAVRIALQQNTLLKRAENVVRQREIAVASQRMDFFPNLTLSTRGSRQFGRGFSPEAGEIVNETSNFFTINAGSSINLFNGFRKLATLNRAQLEVAAGTQRLERTRGDVVFQVMQRYIALVENRGLMRVRTEELDYQRGQLDQIEARVDVGARPVSDLYQQQANVAEAELALLEAEQAFEVSKTQLIQLLQLDPLKPYVFMAPSLVDVRPEPVNYDLERLLERAYAQRADLDAQQLIIEAAEEGVDVAQSGYYPSLDLSVGYGSNWSNLALLPVAGTGAPSRIVPVEPADGSAPVGVVVPGSSPTQYRPSFFDQLDNRRGGSVSLSLSFSIFDRFQTQHAVEQAQVQLQTARYDLQDLRQEIALQVRQANLDYQRAQKALAASEQRLEASRRAREAAQARYRLGAATYIELAQANTAYVNAASQRVSARYDLLFRKKLIDYYIGVLDPNAPLFD